MIATRLMAFCLSLGLGAWVAVGSSGVESSGVESSDVEGGVSRAVSISALPPKPGTLRIVYPAERRPRYTTPATE